MVCPSQATERQEKRKRINLETNKGHFTFTYTTINHYVKRGGNYRPFLHSLY
jgi:hypothetical protein